MSPIVFGIVFGAIMVYLVVDVLTSKTPDPVAVPVVKAGKVSDFYPSVEKVGRHIPQYINVDGKKVGVLDYTVLCVHGESMKKYNIHDKQLVFVKRINNPVVIEHHPVLVLRVCNPEPNDAEFKLRKLVSQIDSIEHADWSDIYDKNKDRISVDKSVFVKQCEKKALKDKEHLEGRVILSETFDVVAGQDSYSLHPLPSVFGTVEYAA